MPALVDELDDDALQVLAQRLQPHLEPASVPETDTWMTTKQAAAHLGLSVHALHRLTSARQVPFHQDGPGCRCWFRLSELDAWRSR